MTRKFLIIVKIHCSQDVLFLEMFLRDRQLSSAFALLATSVIEWKSIFN